MRKLHRFTLPAFGLLLLLAALGWPACASAQTAFKIIHSFAGGSSDGANPMGDLILTNGTLYGMTSGGGAGCGGNGCGALFKSDFNGNVVLLHSFAGGAGDGAAPRGSLTLSSDGLTLYGMTPAGGGGSCSNTLNNIAGCGTLFKSDTTSGAGYSMIGSLTGATDPHLPMGSLLNLSGTLYGTSAAGGSGAGTTYGVSGYGTLFSSDTSGDINVLHPFGVVSGDGAIPLGSLVASSGGTTLYGMTSGGGTNGVGTVFKSDVSGNASVLYSFDGAIKGQGPVGALVLSGSTLYGMASGGGANGLGTIFKSDLSGNVSLLHTFAGGAADGALPWGSLTLSADGNTLYGTTLTGGGTGCGGNGCGTIFKIATSGGATFQVLHAFNVSATDGGLPYGSLILSGGTLYGMTYAGGTGAKGVIFSLGPAGVASTSPASGATAVATTSLVTATFNAAMESSSITAANFTLTNVTNGGTAVAGTVTYDASSQTATFTPTGGLSEATTYTATLTSGITDAGGAPLASAPFTWTFTTSLAPTVTAKSPVGSNVAVSSLVTATFSSNMASSSITTTTFSVTHTVSGSPVAVAGSVAYNSATKTATFTPSASLTAGTSYTVTISTGVTDSTGEPMAAPVIWTFTTATPGTTSPSVTIVSPQAGATGVPLNTLVKAQFSTAMNASTINSTNFTLSGGVTGSVSYNSTTYVATLSHSATLAANTTYTATITTAVTDASGNPLPATYTWTFTTGTTSDTTPPYVTIVSPASGSKGAAANSVVQAQFSEAVDPTTVTTATFLVTQNRLNTSVAGTVSVAGNLATFTPTNPIGYPYDYTATITTGVTDLAGNAMSAAYAWSFTTVDTSTPVYSGAGTATVGSVTGTGNITVSVSSGALYEIHAVSDGNAALNSTGKPSGLLFPDGMVFYQVTGLTPGATITATITFPTVISAEAKVYKAGSSGFYDFTAHVLSISGNTVTVSLTDGGAGDDDGAANGVIVDPIGVADPIPAISLPLSWNFGSVTIGQSSSQTFTISETSGGVLILGALTLTGTNASEFSVPTASDHCSGATLSSSSCTFSLTFTPASAGVKVAYISVTTNDPDQTDLTGTLSASGSSPSAPTSFTSSSSSGNSCFIATAAYGSYLDPHVATLRAFRDRRLLTNAPGRAFVALYYRHSPAIADFIRGHDTLRALTRWCLTPFIYAVDYPYSALPALAVALGIIALAAGRRKGRPGR
jgi:uncharacterized repeat protein (TIGR03803 family)